MTKLTPEGIELQARDIRTKLVAAQKDPGEHDKSVADRIEGLARMIYNSRQPRTVRVLHLADTLKLWNYPELALSNLVQTVESLDGLKIIIGEDDDNNSD